MRTEKVTINLSMAELGQIDYLVAKGIYANRSDYIRLAIRKQTEQHAQDIDNFLAPPYLESDEYTVRTFGGVGIISLRQSDIEYLQGIKRKIKIRVLGLLIIDSDVTVENIKEVVIEAEIYGKVIAGKEIRDVLVNKE